MLRGALLLLPPRRLLLIHFVPCCSTVMAHDQARHIECILLPFLCAVDVLSTSPRARFSRVSCVRCFVSIRMTQIDIYM
ncbi:hypothetical protein ACQJBY_065391 [Aegilops geniculata]